MLPVAPLVVAIEVAPTPPTEQAMRLLVEACSAGLRNASCQAAKSLKGKAAAVALVTWRGETEVLVEVGAESQAHWSQREIFFSPEDPSEERWRSIGFSVSLLAERALPAASAWDASQPSEKLPHSATDHGGFTLAARATVASAFAGGSARWGGELRFVGDVPRGWFYSGALDAARAEHRGIEARWIGGSLGGGHAVAVRSNLTVKLRLEAQLEQIRTRLVEGVSYRTAWVPGVSFGVDGSWELGHHWALTAGGELFVSDGPSNIRLNGQEVGTIGAVGFLAALGVALVP